MKRISHKTSSKVFARTHSHTIAGKMRPGRGRAPTGSRMRATLPPLPSFSSPPHTVDTNKHIFTGTKRLQDEGLVPAQPGRPEPAYGVPRQHGADLPRQVSVIRKNRAAEIEQRK